MAGNSQRRGAVRKAGTKKGPTVGSGGVRRRGLEGKGATPPAHERPNHPAAKRAAKAARKQQGRHKKTDETEIVLGRNPVLECLRAGVARHRAVRGAGHRLRRTAHRSRADRRRQGASRSSRCRATTWTGSRPTACTRASPCRCRPTITHIPTTCSPRRKRKRRSHFWSRWTTSPIRVTSVRSSGRSLRSVGTECSSRSAGPRR